MGVLLFFCLYLHSQIFLLERNIPTCMTTKRLLHERQAGSFSLLRFVSGDINSFLRIEEALFDIQVPRLYNAFKMMLFALSTTEVSNEAR